MHRNHIFNIYANLTPMLNFIILCKKPMNRQTNKKLHYQKQKKSLKVDTNINTIEKINNIESIVVYVANDS